jgi:hypothetical protein
MDAKLTLKLNHTVIEKAKEYAKEKNTSLSRLIENYLQSITKEESEKAGSNITPLVKSLSGIINMQQVYNFKKDYASHLVKKYK